MRRKQRIRSGRNYAIKLYEDTVGTMIIGLLSDIHGNSTALSAVLSEARKCGVEQLLIAGDFVGYYYNIREVLELLDEWDYQAISGNHERMLMEWRAGRRREEIRTRYGSALEVACNTLNDKRLDFLASLPPDMVVNVGRKSVLLCHGSPAEMDRYVYPDAKASTLDEFFVLPHDLVIFGHTHYPLIWERDGKKVVNPGSVGQTRDRNPGACWAVWDTESMTVNLRRESYDPGELIEQCYHHDPSLEYLSKVLTRT